MFKYQKWYRKLLFQNNILIFIFMLCLEIIDKIFLCYKSQLFIFDKEI